MPTLKFSRFIVLVFLICVTMSSCFARNPWIQASDIPFNDVRYDSDTHTIWLADFNGRAIYQLDRPSNDLDFKNAKKIALPSDSYVSEICISNGVWISNTIILKPLPPKPLFNPQTSVLNSISKYTDNASWITVKNIDGPAECKPLKNQDVIFWRQNEVIRFNAENTELQYVDVNKDWKVIDIADEPNGNLWLSTRNGEIYRQTLDKWVLVDKFSPNSNPRLFIDKSGNLWVASNNKYIYKYSAVNSIFLRKKEIESSLGGWQDFFQDNSGAMWVVTSDKLLRQKGIEFQEIAPPPYSSVLNFGFFDSETNALFVSTEEGVFALDINKLSK